MTRPPPEIAAGPLRSAEEELGEPRRVATAGMVAVTAGALGIVFGDIGTSPLYALQTVFAIDNRAAVRRDRPQRHQPGHTSTSPTSAPS
jgi:KUP system potassium uptake protein